MPDTSFGLLIAQHREIAALLDEMNAAIDEAEKTPQAAEPLSRISRLGAQIGEVWQPHIREEETIFSPERVGADRAYMAGEMPPIISQELVPVVWKDQWAPMKPFLLP